MVGLYPGSKSWQKAEAAGLKVMTTADAAKAADTVMILVSDHIQGDLYNNEIAPHMTAGKTLMFAHGFNIHFGFIKPSPDIDVTMVAPKAPGHRVREAIHGRRGRSRRWSRSTRMPPARRSRRRSRMRWRSAA